MTQVLDLLRSGAFLTRERIVLWPAAMLVAFAVGILFLAVTAHGNSDYKGRPLGSDFASFYTAATYARAGDAQAPYDPQRQFAKEKAIFGSSVPFFGWHNPPFFLLVITPLASLPYIQALLVWQFASLMLYLGALALLLRSGHDPAPGTSWSWVVIALAFPAVFVNLIHGQNGLFTAALLAGGLALLDERPVLAGAVFALLVYKPQFGVLIPVVLLATARWRAFGAAALTVILLAALVTDLFGFGIWSAFLASTQFTRTVVLEQGAAGFHKMQSVFAWVRLLHGPVPLAYALQAMVSVAAIAFLAWIWRSGASFADKGAALCIAALLATPYCYDYDLAALAPAIALLGAQGMAHGFRPYEKSLLVLLGIVPIVTRGVAEVTLIPLGLIAMFAAGVFLVRAASRNTRDAVQAVATPDGAGLSGPPTSLLSH